jgi:hypothetical protein
LQWLPRFIADQEGGKLETTMLFDGAEPSSTAVGMTRKRPRASRVAGRRGLLEPTAGGVDRLGFGGVGRGR